MKQIQVTGHLGKDAEVLKKEKSKEYFTLFFSVAHTEKFKDASGKEISKTEWFSCFKRYKKEPNKILEILKKGTKVFVSGKPSFNIVNNNQGVYINVNIDVNEIDFMTKSDDND
ncbi:single-stranded DNA-binding protein [Mariniflexile gromovii]|uniref:Single-stranded DNA-binding protein n=1 Tax=Mariniflexile gromovii TaxID=362523 RepID=A0ABS4BPA3_9FLAO|nr:single-stranded DNA-binding protein [Mariniflexile gromovii]MBP0902406.1 single-stranded DNA-binding protein [Mariniflexile gromovii]